MGWVESTWIDGTAGVGTDDDEEEVVLSLGNAPGMDVEVIPPSRCPWPEKEG